MKTHSVYDLVTGKFTGLKLDLPPNVLAHHIPAGCGVIEGSYDFLAVKIDIKTMQIVDYQPDAPAATDLVTWAWSANTKRWVSVPTLAAQAKEVREKRDMLLSATDWRVIRSIEPGQSLPPAWIKYRQALRDITKQEGFPSSINWPVAPE